VIRVALAAAVRAIVPCYVNGVSAYFPHLTEAPPPPPPGANNRDRLA